MFWGKTDVFTGVASHGKDGGVDDADGGNLTIQTLFSSGSD